MNLCIAHDLYVQQKCSNHALNNLFSLCKFLWIIDSLVICPRPHFEAPACPCTPKLLQTKEHTQLLLLPLFSFSNVHLSISRSVGVCQFTTTFVIISDLVNYFKQQINLIQYYQLNLILLGVQRL